MFTGIIEEVGKIIAIAQDSIKVECELVLEDTKLGDSIAVNGVCLTVTKRNRDFFEADVSEESFKVTALSGLKIGSEVNLERAMPANGRFGGHVVTGHVDGVGVIQSVEAKNGFYDIKIKLSPDNSKYVVKKGSIAVNGISLTVAEVKEDTIKLAIIPHTFEKTNLSKLKTGDFVNIETDIMAKYIEKFLSTSDNKSNIDFDFLQRNGFC